MPFVSSEMPSQLQLDGIAEKLGIEVSTLVVVPIDQEIDAILQERGKKARTGFVIYRIDKLALVEMPRI